jgi:signal peptidase I
MLTTLRSTPEFIEVCDGLLSRHHVVRFTAEGWSMYPAIRDGEIVEVAAIDPRRIRRGDVLLCRLGSGTVAHRVVRLERKANGVSAIVLRGDAAFAPDAPLSACDILGKVIATTRGGVRRPLDTMTARIVGWIAARAWRAKRWLVGAVC